MNLCHIVPSLEERHGGPTKSVQATAEGLAAIGHTVELLATDGNRALAASNGSLSTRVFLRGWPQSLCPSGGLRYYLLQSRYEVIHHHSLWLRTLHYGHRASSAQGVPLVISPRGMMSQWAWRHHAWRKFLARSFVHPGALSAVNGWHATSESEATDIRALGFKQPICVAPNGVTSVDPEEHQKSAEYWHRVCPETRERPVALFYSRFHRKKRVIELIDVWLEHAPRDWLLLIVGIPQEYSVAMLEAYVLRVLGTGRIRVFDGGGAPPPYPVASLFLLPSHNENFGLAISEALSRGVPAVVTNSTPWEGLNANGGWCVPWADFPKTLAAAASEGVDRLRERGRTSRDWVLRDFSWQKTAHALAGFYAGLREQGS